MATQVPPPRQSIPQRQSTTTVVPLDQLWTQIPQTPRQEVLQQLTLLLAKQLAPLTNKEDADD